MQKRVLQRFALSALAGKFLVRSGLIRQLTNEGVDFAIDTVLIKFVESSGDA
jgi:hypothetical protein